MTINSSRKFKLLSLVLSAAMTIVLLYAVFQEQSLGEFVEMIAAISKRGFVCYLALNLLALVVRALRYRVLLKEFVGVEKDDERLPGSWQMILVTAVRNAFVDMFPMRLGELSFFYVASRFGVGVGSLVLCFGACLALDIAVLLGLAAIVLAVSSFGAWYAFLVFAVFAVLAIFLILSCC